MAYSWCECPIAFDSPEKESPVHTVIDSRNTFALSYCNLLFEDIANIVELYITVDNSIFAILNTSKSFNFWLNNIKIKLWFLNELDQSFMLGFSELSYLKRFLKS